MSPLKTTHGDIISKRLNRKDTIREVKVKLSSSVRSPSPPPEDEPLDGPTPPGPPGFRGRHHHHHHMRGMRMREFLKRAQPQAVAMHPSVDDMRLYVVRVTGQVTLYEELADELTVEDHKLKDRDKLHLLSYRSVFIRINVQCKVLHVLV